MTFALKFEVKLLKTYILNPQSGIKAAQSVTFDLFILEIMFFIFQEHKKNTIIQAYI